MKNKRQRNGRREKDITKAVYSCTNGKVRDAEIRLFAIER